MRRGLDITDGMVVAGTPKGVQSACITDLSVSNTKPHSRIAAWSGETFYQLATLTGRNPIPN